MSSLVHIKTGKSEFFCPYVILETEIFFGCLDDEN